MTEAPESPITSDGPTALERPRPGLAADEAALTAVYDEHRAELFGYLLRFTRDREAAEDLVQDAFIRLIRESRAGRMPDDVRPWLYRVATNAAISRGRRGAVLHRLMPRLLDRREPVRPEGEAIRAERDVELHAALDKLGSDDRAALLLAAEGFHGREIAALTGHTEGATRTRMCRARLELRGLLEVHGGDR